MSLGVVAEKRKRRRGGVAITKPQSSPVDLFVCSLSVFLLCRLQQRPRPHHPGHAMLFLSVFVLGTNRRKTGLMERRRQVHARASGMRATNPSVLRPHRHTTSPPISQTPPLHQAAATTSAQAGRRSRPVRRGRQPGQDAACGNDPLERSLGLRTGVD